MPSLLLFAALLAILCAPSQAGDFYGRVTQVFAGDRLEIVHDGRRQHLRLYGVACPKGDFGDQARQFTRNMANARGVHVVTGGHDHHGSTWVDIHFLGGRSLSHELVRAGLARWDRDAAPDDMELACLEQDARDARRGFWAQQDELRSASAPRRQKKKRNR